MRWTLVVCVIIAIFPQFLWAQSKSFSLSAPPELVESKFLKHLLPRFSLKTGIRIPIQDTGADTVLNDEARGIALFDQGDTRWHLESTAGDNEYIEKFISWIKSDVGARTITAFKPKTGAGFAPAGTRAVEVEEVTFDGNIDEGEKLSLYHCGRCHVVNEKNRMNSLGSTPSFAMLRTLGDWSDRFGAFFVLNPHPSFTQIEDVTEPFDPSRPSPIAPVEMTLDDLDAILAYVSKIKPAELGAPVKHQ